jgi:hypothetical protein
MADERKLLWIARYEGRLLYIPHENIEMVVSNIDYQGRVIPRMPIRLFRMTHENEATYIDINPNEDTMNDLLGRIVDLGNLVDYSEGIRRQQAEVIQQRLEATAQMQGPEEITIPVTSEVPNGERTKASFPEPLPVDREEVAVTGVNEWDADASALPDVVTEQAQQNLIEEVTPRPEPPKADKVRKRNGNRR